MTSPRRPSSRTDAADVGSKPSDIENKVTVSSIARRRLAVIVTRLKMSQTVSDVSDGDVPWLRAKSDPQAVRTIEQGHIRVGTQPVTDPAMLIPRRMEDFVTWVDTSARKRTIMKYNDEVGSERGVIQDRDEKKIGANDSSTISTCCRFASGKRLRRPPVVFALPCRHMYAYTSSCIITRTVLPCGLRILVKRD